MSHVTSEYSWGAENESDVLINRLPKHICHSYDFGKIGGGGGGGECLGLVTEEIGPDAFFHGLMGFEKDYQMERLVM